MSDTRKEIIIRIYLVFLFLCLFGVAIIGKVLHLQLVEGDFWKGRADSLTLDFRTIEAARGSIYASDGSLLGTSIPVYEIRWDAGTESLPDDKFRKEIDSLSICLAGLFKDKSPEAYKREFVTARANAERYFLVRRNVSFNEMQEIRKFPLFRLGKYKGGFLVYEKRRRALPFDLLAQRTVGFFVNGIKPVGLEGAYNEELSGTNGKQLMQKLSGNAWMPLNDGNEIEPKDGKDIITTLDINYQDVAENALLKQLSLHNADHGCAVLMDVKSGEIKAIANLQRDSSGNYKEYYNFAIGESTEPGSTFKMISLMAAMEDGLVDIDDTVDAEGGTKMFYDRKMVDSHLGTRRITVQRAFEISSNVGVSKKVVEAYQKDQRKFVQALFKMGIQNPLGLEISGEPAPMIKKPGDKDWTGVTLPWMSIGYELRMTPLQLLTIYNAIANNGVMVKPRFVKEITQRGKTLKTFETQVLNQAICSPSTIAKAKKLLEGVVENGTASNLKNNTFRIAGKTGTAQIANEKYGYKYKSKTNYLASFIGYFPADLPRYSCLVMVSSPSNDLYYGNVVAGPVFKEIADKVFATGLDMHPVFHAPKTGKKETIAAIPVAGNRKDFEVISSTIGVNGPAREIQSAWVEGSFQNNGTNFKSRKLKGVPDVTGMGLRDALHLLESTGLVVRFSGKGKVRKQSISPGKELVKGEEIQIELM